MRIQPLVDSVRTSWTGRILLLNTIVFVLMAWQSQAIFMPSPDVIVLWGAKDPGRLVAGEYWRFITPVFVHIGILHYAFNSWALWVIGRQIEPLLGKRFFLLAYLLSGVAGVVMSSLWTLGLSAGASGAIFGLIGCGFIMEFRVKRAYEAKTGQKMHGSAYASMLFANLVFGFLVPQIDNAAHIGGLVCGIIFMMGFLKLRMSTDDSGKRWLGGTVLALTVVLAVGGFVGSSRDYVLGRVWQDLEKKTEPEYVMQASEVGIEIDPLDVKSRVRQAEIQLMAGENEEAMKNLVFVINQPAFRGEAHQMAARLREQGLNREAEVVEKL